MLNYLKLFIWSGIYYLQKCKSETIYKIIIKNIKESGCVLIKLTQWILPKVEVIYNIDKNNPKDSWFFELEDIYEDCEYHSIQHTKKVYRQDFNRDIEDDYEIIGNIASGSIGQVYKLINKYDGTEHAMKVIHPNVGSKLYLIQAIVYLIYRIPILKDYFRYYFPFDMNDFISDFKTQTDMICEGNNLLYFNEIYKDQDVFVIPKVIKLSKNILIMSYEEGECFDDIESSDYIKMKIILLNKIFVKNNDYTHRLMHGDLHKGNWKVRLCDDDKIKIVIYDYGFCWTMPDYLYGDDLLFIDRAFITPIKDRTAYIKACKMLINNEKNSIEDMEKTVNIVEKDLRDGGMEGEYIFDDPIFLLNTILYSSRKGGFLINGFLFQSIIIHNQLCRNLEKYSLNIKNGKDDYYSNQILNIITYCETLKICPEFLKVLRDEYDDLGIEKNQLFEDCQYLEKYNLQELI